MPKRKIIDEEQQVIADQPVSSSSPVSKKAKSSPQKAQNSIVNLFSFNLLFLKP